MKKLLARDVVLGVTFLLVGAGISLVISFAFYYQEEIEEAEDTASEAAEQAEAEAQRADDLEVLLDAAERATREAERAEAAALGNAASLQELMDAAEAEASLNQRLAVGEAARWAYGLAESGLNSCDPNPAFFRIDPLTLELQGVGAWVDEREDELRSIRTTLTSSDGDWDGALERTAETLLPLIERGCAGFAGVPRFELGGS